MKYITIILIGLILVIGCVQSVNQEKPISKERDFIQENTDIYRVLSADGFDPLVDTTDSTVLIRLELPVNYTSEASIMSILGSVSAITKSDEIIIQLYRNGKKSEEVKTKKQDVLDAINGKISIEDFLNGLDWKK